MDRQINGIKREEQKVTKSIKEAAKRGDKDVCRFGRCWLFWNSVFNAMTALVFQGAGQGGRPV